MDELQRSFGKVATRSSDVFHCKSQCGGAGHSKRLVNSLAFSSFLNM